MADINAVAKAFTDFYYPAFDNDRASLQALYRDRSMLTWEQEQIMGVTNIIEKLKNLPFTKVVHRVVTVDAQPASATIASLVVLVTGQLLVDDGANVLQFSQMFQLIPENGTYYVQNDVFRLVYG
ncbi:NTF2-like protein [Cutaneotrichosporon oleaginosum]|uniref:Nuclear transport factor 2 n=1 Tax=Cutaneotrichosporon oleaginosum TaxID=879819 RepID=A0A0J0XUR9_9TREE|nr:NTF2-like protein [Cutaneotrichosporon oleaginosum]KLT44823.1 NTF2-like protein [Cutaneotrichosporon oleaginosum]